MRWIVAFFLALLSIPLAQVAADAWDGRPGPHMGLSPVALSHPAGGLDLAVCVETDMDSSPLHSFFNRFGSRL